MDVDELRRLPPFAGLTDVGLQRLAMRAAELRAAGGQVLALEGDPGAGMFVLYEGNVEVELRSGRLELGPGDFFGELAALDWGADYGYPRLATVVAAGDLRLARLTAAALRELMREVPAIDAAIRRAASERLAIS